MNAQEIETLLTDFTNALRLEDTLDVSEPADAALYVEGLHGGIDAVGRLRREILRVSGGGVFLFTGQSGTGKSTELKRLKRDLVAQKCKVYYCDLEDWLNLNGPITLSSFLVALLSSWVDQLGTVHAQRTPFDRLKDFFLKTKLIPESLTLSAGKTINAQLKFALQSDENFRADLEKNLRSQFASVVGQAKTLVAEIIVDVCAAGERCVILADSLEKLNGSGDNANDVYESVQRLFVSEGAALRFEGAHMVYSVSPYLLEQNSNLAASLGSGVVVNMPSVHVLQSQSTAVDIVGIAAVCQLIQKRFPRWAEVFSLPQLERMAEYTGGDLRSFLRAVRIALGGDIVALPVPDAEVEYALQQICPSRNIKAEYIDWMAKVQKTHLAQLGGIIDGRVLQQYLASKHVLAYLNGQDWYAIHPMLRDWVQERAAAHALAASQPAA
jgi:DNA polymerase III delta prime subunit